MNYQNYENPLHKIIQASTLGIITPLRDGYIIKDPFTAIGNMAAHFFDYINNRELSKGVWIGKRTIGNNPIGFSSYFLQLFNANPLHYAFLADGKAYHVSKSPNQSEKKCIYIDENYEDLAGYEWFYKGQNLRSKQQLQSLITQINSLKVSYMLVTRNCIDLARGLTNYSRKVCGQSEILGGLIQLMSIGNTGGSLVVGSCFGYVSGMKFYFMRTFGKRLGEELSNFFSWK